MVVRQSISNNALGYVQVEGIVTVAVQGAVTRGNYLRTSTTAGKAEDAGTADVVVDGVFARALTGFAGPGAGTVVAILLGGANEKKSGFKFVETLDCASGTSKSTATLPTDSNTFLVLFEGVSLSAADFIGMRLNGDSGNYYAWNRTDDNGAAQGSMQIGELDVPGHTLDGWLNVPRLAGANQLRIGGMALLSTDITSSNPCAFSWGRYEPTTLSAITSMTFFAASGSFDGGKIHIYQMAQ